MSLCPRFAERAAMTEEEFWEDVLHQLYPDQAYYPDDERPDPVAAGLIDTPCTVCGERGACAYDSEGRALIHTTDDADDT